MFLFLTVIVLAFWAIPYRADAYIDLGLAGSLFQLLYVIGLAVLAFIVTPFLFFWKRISNCIKTNLKKKG